MKLLLITFFVFTITSSFAGQKSTIDVFLGGSNAIGDGSEYMNFGFNVGVSALYKTNQKVSIGAGLIYNNWKIEPNAPTIQVAITYTELLGILRTTKIITDDAQLFFLGRFGGVFNELRV